MGSVANLGNLYCRTLQGCSVAVNRVGGALPLRPVRIRFPTPPTCGIIPPHRGSIGIRFRHMGRIQ
jgi:hypothetical protein